eukprot:CAMPEP_0113629490 /NCGR_PEP_ID=MMETSP0017_2-20120614/15308_1 /TAXON_ID=2856 /ORGANISM="Cylindrotheca closterium" /LENGTH=695 /DNA_ID=CAMNT_0000539889 /DNA_START=49 /DNA_END=2136 /DNA_ORIENTATION=+ /assembly_acc=CAM_ASM_000147
MGNRVKGRPKKSSIKANSHSKMGSKRKLSRMGKKQKKNHAGLEATFVGRSKCLKMLQITIKDFRRLCILKGIYPREPRGRFPGHKKGQTFYHIKDIRAIAHEPVLEKFREFRAFTKKVRRAAGRNEQDEALRKNAMCPTYTLHHLVRERYPRFNDALSDLDDALTLTYLFAALPSTANIKPKVVTKAKSLAAAWGAYCSTAACITKSFISVKGIYFEATIRSVPVRWVVPHSFTQFMPEDVDYRVMTTFFEFYETLLHFALYKLYNDLEVRYPLPTDGGEVKGSTSFILGANLRSLTNALNSTGNISNIVSESVEDSDKKEKKGKTKEEKKKEKELIKSVGAALNSINEDSDSEDEEDDVDVAGPLKAALESMADDEARTVLPGGNLELDDESMKRRRLFSGFKFFLSREVPRGYLELVSLAFGGIVGWEGPNSPISANDPSITHHVVDRPKLPASYSNLPKSREFIQPQWILDCANNVFLLPVAKYSVGVTLPPHLSPWVDNEEEGYKPAYAEEIERLKNGEPAVAENDDQMETDEAADEAEEEMEDAATKEKDSDTEEESDDESEEEEEDPAAKKKQDKKKLVAKKARAEQRRKQEEEEAHALAKTMMSRKASHLYGRMQHGIGKRTAKVENLRNKRKAIEEENRSKRKDTLGRTPLKQKVDRLRKERKRLEDEYSNPTGVSTKKSKKKRRST